MAQYAIGLILSETFEKELQQLRDGFADSMVYLPVPHITLAYRFEINTSAEQLNDRLSQVALTRGTIILVFEEAGYFQDKVNTAYLAIRNPQPVIGLHYDIYNRINDLLPDGFEDPFKGGNYVPHLTIGTDIPDDVFLSLKNRLDKTQIHFETEVNSFSLYEDGKGKSVFKLSG